MENYGNYFNNNSSSFGGGGGGGGGEPQLPPGYRFHPTDEELITYYLLKKVFDSSFSGRAIAEVDLNKCEPWHLPEKAYEIGGGKEKEWYLFSLRDRKYPTGLRTNRATEAGYWKATGKDREIYGSKTGSLIGMKKTLVFYRGRAPKGEKTNWVMHEYRLEGKFACHYLARSSKDEWVIARVFHKTSTIGTSKKAAGWVGSPSSSSASTSTSTLLVLPPLLDPSPIIPSADRESSSSSYYDNDNNNNVDQHVPCFSMSHGAATALPVNPNLSSLIFSASDGGGGRNNGGMEENLHLPNWFMSSVLAAPRHQHHQLSAAMPTMQMAGDTSLLDRKVGDTDQLACMWTFYSS